MSKAELETLKNQVVVDLEKLQRGEITYPVFKQAVDNLAKYLDGKQK